LWNADPVSRSRTAALATVGALVLLAGCGGSERADKPAATPTRTAHNTPKTGGPATSPAALEAKGYVVIPRTNIALRPPDGFVVDDSMPGLVHRGGTGATTIMVAQMQSRYDDPDKVVDDMITGLKDKSKAAAQGLEFDSVQRISVDGRPAVGAVGTQKARGATFKKAFVAFPSEGFLVTMTATLEPGTPVSAADAFAVVRGARWAAKSATGKLDYSIKPAAGYDKLKSSAGLGYSLDGKQAPGVPLFIVRAVNGSHVPPGSEDQALEAAEAAFRGLAGNPTPDTEERVTVAGLLGWELAGNGSENGRKTQTYAAFLFTDDDRLLTLVGTFDPDSYPDQTEAFRAMARSLKLRR
jgi:hypothetical protein